MPSGRTHDAVTIFLAIPVFALAYSCSRDLGLAAVIAAAFVFGGVMFGPDLDTASNQYSRWWIFKSLWFPYKTFFKHRSRWSHGLIFGTLFRVIYFAGIISIGCLAVGFAAQLFSGMRIAGIHDLVLAWEHLGQQFSRHIGQTYAIAAFLGLWLGAASHTFADMAGTYIKTGRVQRFL